MFYNFLRNFETLKADNLTSMPRNLEDLRDRKRIQLNERETDRQGSRETDRHTDGRQT